MSKMTEIGYQIDVKEVKFLTPAKIVLLNDGIEDTFLVSVDIINRKVYLSNGDEYNKLSEAVFSHLDQINTLPEDFFMASDEIRQEASKAESTRNEIYHEAMGATNE